MSYANNQLSRRSFLQTATAATVAVSATGAARAQFFGGAKFAYVGTYTDNNGKGIYLYEVDNFTGDLKFVKLVSTVPDPSFLAVSPSGKFLYSTNEVSNFQGSTGSVTSFAINRSTGDLKLLNTVSSVGTGPAYLGLDRSGKFLLVPNYGNAILAVLNINSDGSIGAVLSQHQDVGDLGPTKPTTAPPGSFVNSGHDAPHAHEAVPSLNNKFILQPDLGQDRVWIFAFNSSTGTITPAETPYATLPPGDGPRHLAFHPNGQWVYVITEEASTITLFHFNEQSGAMTAIQTISALPPEFTGTSYGAEVAVSRDGRFVYGSNRLEDSISTFEVKGNGELKFVASTATRGDYTRQFAIAPSGFYMYSCNQHADNVTAFRIDPFNGVPKFTGQFTPVGTPSCIIFV